MPRDGSGIYSTPPGTHGIPDTTILSTPYNANVDDVAQDLNVPRPIVAGGTGATTPAQAMINLGGVPSTGGTMTGPLTISYSSPGLTINKDPGGLSLLMGQTSGKDRWAIDLGNGNLETGGNTGSDFSIDRFADAGSYIESPIRISRSNGQATFSQLAMFGSGLYTTSINCNGNMSISGTINAPTIELGDPSISSTSFIDFHSEGGGHDYDARIVKNPGGNFVIAVPGQDVRITSNNVNIDGNISVGGQISKNSGELDILDNNGAIAVQATNGGAYLRSNIGIHIGDSSNAPLYLCEGGGPTRMFGTGQCDGNFSIGGNNNVGGVEFILGAVCYIRSQGGNAHLWFQSSDGAKAGILYVTNGGASATLNVGSDTGSNSNYTFNFAGNYTIVGQGYKPGGGAWADSSDARIKNVIGDYTFGLDEVLKLRPVRFTFKGNDTPDLPHNQTEYSLNPPDTKEAPKVPYANSPHYQSAKDGREHVGMIAQAVAEVMPGMVTTREGYIDGNKVADLHDLDTTELIYALVNSIKTLNARIDALESK